MRSFGVDERRARLGVRHLLARPGGDALDVARAVVALHSTDPATVFLSVQARSPASDVAAIEAAIYDDRTLLRMLGMRRTMFVVPDATAPAIQSGCTDAIAVVQRRQYAKMLDQAGVGDAAFLDEVADATEKALLARGQATGAQLSADEPRLQTTVTLNEGKAYGGTQRITTWVLLMLAAQGRIVRGRPRGSWTSTLWTWSPVRAWLPNGMVNVPPEHARAELARLWLAAYGPATRADLTWWTGWTAAQAGRALAAAGAVEVDLDGRPGIALADDLEPTRRPRPWVALLPALDPTPMGWAKRDWYLGPHTAALFDRSGNIGPTIWCDGRIVGGWAQRRDGEVVVRLLEDVGREATTKIAAAAERIRAWVGDVRVTPRFRTPLERELSA